ncbi:MAG: DUF882 domain-containing protein [Methylovulum sp.]|nr:DUF882 domain-containing protein [Methylovulum sp.]
MNEHPSITPVPDESRIVSSRRQFLKQIAGGSLLALSSTGLASAAVRHVYHSNTHPKKAPLHNTHAKHPHKAIPTHNSRSRHPHQGTPGQKQHSNGPDQAMHGTHTGFMHKTIALHNINTGDKLNLTYYEQGNYLSDALQEINYLFRDYHTGAVHPIDPLLLDQLHDLKQHLDINKAFHVISGYRSPFTNAHLRNQSYGVAKHSLHMEGRAIDIRLEGFPTKTLRTAALAMRRGGVGYYPSANFVHLDTGEVRTW